MSPVDQVERGTKTFRRGKVQGKAETNGGMNPRRGNIVAVADPRHEQRFDRPFILLQCHDIGKDLAGVGPVGQAIDHRHGGMLCEFDQRLVGHRAHHDDVDIAGQDARRVRDGLAAAELHVGMVQNDGLAAELPHGDIERNARARGCLLEQHGEDRAFCKTRARRSRSLERFLQRFGAVEDKAQRFAIVVVNVNEMTKCHWHFERRVTLEV